VDGLAPHERAWRRCLYATVEQLLLPAVRLGDLYRLLLIEDRRLTEALADGGIGREERADRLRELSDRIGNAGGNAPTPAEAMYGAPATDEEIAAARERLIEALAR
jgi:hypothetical protein